MAIVIGRQISEPSAVLLKLSRKSQEWGFIFVLSTYLDGTADVIIVFP